MNKHKYENQKLWNKNKVFHNSTKMLQLKNNITNFYNNNELGLHYSQMMRIS